MTDSVILHYTTHTGKAVGSKGCSGRLGGASDDSFGLANPPSPTGGALVVLVANGGLCGSGEISMASCTGPGDDEGIGGVVVRSE